MQYRLDDLSFSEFEQLCQSLLKASLSVGVEAWGGSGDWGRDAYCTVPLRYPGSEIQNGPFQFQAKFVKGANAAGAKPGQQLLTAVGKECNRIKSRAQKNPEVYALLTNAPMSPKLRSKLQEKLKSTLPDTIIVLHDGNDICSMLQLQKDIVRSFPQLLSYLDLLDQAVLKIAQENQKPEPPRPLDPALKAQKDLATTTLQKGDTEGAIKFWQKIRELANKSGDANEALLACLNQIIIFVRDDDNPECAQILAKECLTEVIKPGVGRLKCRLYQIISEIHRYEGEDIEALAYAQLSQSHAKEINSKIDIGYALLSQSLLVDSVHPEQSKEASDLMAEAVTVFMELGSSADLNIRESASQGLAECYVFQAKNLRKDRKLEAALDLLGKAEVIFRSLGPNWEHELADCLLEKAEYWTGLKDFRRAPECISEAEKLFVKLESPHGCARSYLSAGEMLESAGRRKDALQAYEASYNAALYLKSKRKSAYYLYRYAIKLTEVNRHPEAQAILEGLADAEWLKDKRKLQVLMAHTATINRKSQRSLLKKRSDQAIAIASRLAGEVRSSRERRSLIGIQGSMLLQTERFQESLSYFNSLVREAERDGDAEDQINGWSHISSAHQANGDKSLAQVAREKIVALGAEKISPMQAAMNLVMMAQEDLLEMNFARAKERLETARKLEPENPAINMIASDLESKLPKLLPDSSTSRETEHSVVAVSLEDVVGRLMTWWKFVPDRKEVVVDVWYYIERENLRHAITSRVGPKFLICCEARTTFEEVAAVLGKVPSLSLWATNFDIVSPTVKKAADVVQIPVPPDLTLPTGTTVIAGSKRVTSVSGESEGFTDLSSWAEQENLRVIQSRAYVLAFVNTRKKDRPVEGRFVGRRRIWNKPEILEFLQSACEVSSSISNFCIPFGEGKYEPNLLAILVQAYELKAVPVFNKALPETNEVRTVVRDSFYFPLLESEQDSAKRAWLKFLSNFAVGPQLAIFDLKVEMNSIGSEGGAKRRTAVVHGFEFIVGRSKVVWPAILV